MLRKTVSRGNVRDNPNPKANIGFVCFVPLNFYVFKNIYKHLPNSEFIVGEPMDVPEWGRVSDSLHNMIDFFSGQKVYWRFIDKSNPAVYGREFYSKYGLLVSTWYRGPLKEEYNQDKKIVRVLYGHAKDLWNFGPWSAHFDLVLSYGPYSQQFLSLYGNSTVVGNPKFDDWFNGTIDQSAVKEIKKRLDPLKPTLLYLPTYGMLSSLHLMATAINKISLNYNVILKLHHVTHLYEKEKTAPYRDNPRIIFQSDRDDILPLLQIADVIISDNSGAIFDAILADKPVVLIDFLKKDFFESYRQNFYFRKGPQFLGVPTLERSLEQQVKLPGREVGPVIRIMPPRSETARRKQEENIFASLQRALIEIEQNEKLFRMRRRKIVQQTFAYNDGKCGKRAADKIIQLLNTPRPRRTFLAEAMERYINDLELEKTRAISSAISRERSRSKELMNIRSLPLPARLKALAKYFF